MQITRSSIDTAKGPADWFTGDVCIDTVAAVPAPSRVTAAVVHFMPGARASCSRPTRNTGTAPRRTGWWSTAPTTRATTTTTSCTG